MTNTLLSAQNFLAALPEELPVFPLSGAVLLPQARLPMNIFEPRYRALVEDALGKGRLFGLIQPTTDEDIENPPFYSVGCAGRITSFNEGEDGRFLIVLTGLCRFRVVGELPQAHAYRSIKPDWTPYLSDLGESPPFDVDRPRLIELMRAYFRKNTINVDWTVVESASDDVLLSTIIMICPLAPNEKQALLEAKDFKSRAEMLMALLEMASLNQPEFEADIRH